jgi:hypothetical protein
LGAVGKVLSGCCTSMLHMVAPRTPVAFRRAGLGAVLKTCKETALHEYTSSAVIWARIGHDQALGVLQGEVWEPPPD